MSHSNMRGYPRSLSFADKTIEVRLMDASDSDALNAFVKTLPSHELLFVRRDIRHPKVIAAWVQANAQNSITSLVAYDGDELVGCTAIVIDPLSWSRHVGELRVLLAPSWRGYGLGRWLVQESFALALGLALEKLTVQMTVDQQAAIAVFEDLGFCAESVLRNQVKDIDGKSYDLALLSLDVAEAQLRLQLLGLSEALSAGDDRC